MRSGKHKVQHLSLLSVLVPFGSRSGYAHMAIMMGEKIPKVPKRPGPNIKRFPLKVICQPCRLTLHCMDNLLNKC